MAIFDFITKYIPQHTKSLFSKYMVQPTRSVSNFLGSHTAHSLGNSVIDALKSTNLINDAQVNTGRDVLQKIKMGSDKVGNLLDSIK
jgi:hypothetical protein